MAAFVGTASPDVLLDMKLDDDRYIELLRKLISEVEGTCGIVPCFFVPRVITRTPCACQCSCAPLLGNTTLRGDMVLRDPLAS